MRSFISICLLTLFSLPVQSALAQDIVIGGGLVVSGPFASYGVDAKQGVDLAVTEINAAGGVLGRKLRVDYEDTAGDRAKAVAVYQKFAASKDVVWSLFISSAEFVAMNPVAEKLGLPYTSIGSVIPFTGFAPCGFRVNLILSNAMPVVLGQLSASGVKRVAVINDLVNNQTVAESDIVRKALAAQGMTLVASETYSTGEQNFNLQLARIRAANPDLIWVSATTDEGALIISQARSLGIKAGIIGGAGLNDPRIGQLSGGSAEGVMTFALYNAEDARDVVKKFVTAFKGKYNGAPSAYNALGYDATYLIADAIKRAKSTDRDAVCAAYGKTENFNGVNGTFTYAGPGDNQKQTPQILVYTKTGFVPQKK